MRAWSWLSPERIRIIQSQRPSGFLQIAILVNHAALGIGCVGAGKRTGSFRSAPGTTSTAPPEDIGIPPRQNRGHLIGMHLGLCPHRTRFAQGFFEHGISHGIDAMIKYKSKKLQAFSGLFTIEWE